MPKIIQIAKKHHGLNKKLKTHTGVSRAILHKYQIKEPKGLIEDDVACLSFVASVALKYKKAHIESALVRSLKKSQKRKLKKNTREKIKVRGYVPIEKLIKRNDDVKDTDWDALATFFSKPIEDLTVISHLPSSKFYQTPEWRTVRYFVLQSRGNNCECCSRGKKEDVPIHVDHIFARSKMPSHSLNLTNLQILCEDCNMAKSNIDYTDWRKS